MMDEIRSLWDFLKSASLPRVGLVVLMVCILYVLFDAYTGRSHLERLRAETQLLEQLQRIDDAQPNLSPDLASARRAVVDELTEFSRSGPWADLEVRGVSASRHVPIWRYLTGALPFAMLAFFGLKKGWRRHEFGLGVLSAFLAVLAAFASAALPTFGNEWVNYLGFPLAQIVVLAVSFGLVFRDDDDD